MASTTTKLYLGSTLLVDLTAFALASSLTAHADNGSIDGTLNLRVFQVFLFPVQFKFRILYLKRIGIVCNRFSVF